MQRGRYRAKKRCIHAHMTTFAGMLGCGVQHHAMLCCDVMRFGVMWCGIEWSVVLLCLVLCGALL